ncbi:putative metallo-beta-lactamase superfamily protein [Colletotrichum sublineola]|uniref:Putative metallo-beta-lactamase superfamily protein n=1 Tax=Colletotrichum sublineola TaxID=1173701 RepID=A0A066XAS5_COLSU|nr:putative metallo-beta-lactamase superfamily protein [Colletotrichum sublineola]
MAPPQGSGPRRPAGRRHSTTDSRRRREVTFHDVFDRLLDDNEVFGIGDLEARALHPPSHTTDHLGYMIRCTLQRTENKHLAQNVTETEFVKWRDEYEFWAHRAQAQSLDAACR